jgi:hypothetical protein
MLFFAMRDDQRFFAFCSLLFTFLIVESPRAIMASYAFCFIDHTLSVTAFLELQM